MGIDTGGDSLLSIVFAFLGDDHKEANTAINTAPSHQITPHMCQYEVLTIGVDVEGCREASALDLCHFEGENIGDFVGLRKNI